MSSNRAESRVRKDPGSAVALAIALVAVLSIEALYLDDLWKHDEESRKADDQLEASNWQMERHIGELRSATQKISATFTRLNDGIVRVAGSEGRLPFPGHNPKGNPEYADNKVTKSLREYGLVVKSIQESRREASISFAVGSNRLELHRLVPFLAEQENSNAFLFIDKLNLVRPTEIPSFSMNPTGLETDLLIRVLSGPK
jgi:hypothetical protein